VEVNLTSALESYNPRACDCHFCRKNDAAYISDPNGRVVIRTNALSHLKFTQQGDELAEFLFCATCDQLLGVRWHQYGSVNARILFDHSSFGPQILASPKQLSADEKVVRWTELWFPEFVVAVTNA
jgi:hypothetical protein